ncbi:MAG: SpoIIE family protein phosphatase, partial [Calditrichia bacterium]
LEVLQNGHAIDLVLTDINMPQMDGLTLLEKMRELNKPLLKSIVVSAYGDMENIRTAMNRGAFDFVTKPINLNDLEATISKTLQELAVLKSALRDHDEYIALQQELEIARHIQLSILPKSFPASSVEQGFEINATIETAKEVGGDFYDYFKIDNDRLGFLIGDVSGKGVPAAIFMAVSKTTIKATALRGFPPNECLNLVNNVLVQESVPNVFVTVFYGILNFRTGELEFCNAGHNQPFLIGDDHKVSMLREVDGIPMGFLANFQYSKQSIQLKNDETIFLYTDGVTEAMDEKEIEFSEKNLEKILRISAAQSLPDLNRNVVTEVKNHTNSRPPGDDITVLSLRYCKNDSY